MRAYIWDIPIPQQRVRDFCQRWKIAELSLFGSVLREDFGPDSDVDVLVTFSNDAQWSLYEWVEMIAELREIFGRDVDLLSRQSLRNPFRRHEILKTRETLYAA
ncbi:MAG: DNA polymerase subunit beta [Acidobacteria bacterium]|nr:MAG: DNA polymerase subunit beta [Acidobacteriota bacterium]